MPVPPGPEPDVCRPRRPGLLCNPGSGRLLNRHGFIGRAERLFPGGISRQGRDPGEIGGALRELVGAGADIIIVLGGDGTLQAVLDQLPAVAAGKPPPIAVIPCGSTNMSALDLGSGGKPAPVLERLRRRIAEEPGVQLLRRPVLQVTGTGQPVRRGMFFGAGTITTGVRYFRERVRGRGLTGEAASAIAVCRMLLRFARGTASENAPPLRARIAEDGHPAAEGTFLLLFASTLDRLLFGTRPWWGREAAPIHLTTIREKPRQFWRSLPALARGVAAKLSEPDFHSRNLQAFDLMTDADFVLDGEIHAVPPGGTLRIDTTDMFRFAVP